MEVIKDILSLLGVLFVFVIFVLVDGACTASAQPYMPVESFVQVRQHSKFKSCASGMCEVIERVDLGSGFVVHNTLSNSWIVTAGHVCRPPLESLESRVEVLTNGKTLTDVEVIHIARSIDFCLLFLTGTRLPPTKISEKPPRHGDRAYALAAPFGIYEEGLIPQFSGVYSGKASNIPDPEDANTKLTELDTYTIPSRPGSSGGPIFNSKGEIIGMIVMAHPAFETFALSTPYEALKLSIGVITRGSKVEK